MRERRNVMRLHIQSGISDIDEIKSRYNSLGEGGDKTNIVDYKNKPKNPANVIKERLDAEHQNKLIHDEAYRERFRVTEPSNVSQSLYDRYSLANKRRNEISQEIARRQSEVTIKNLEDRARTEPLSVNEQIGSALAAP